MIYAEFFFFTITSICGSKMSYFAWTFNSSSSQALDWLSQSMTCTASCKRARVSEPAGARKKVSPCLKLDRKRWKWKDGAVRFRALACLTAPLSTFHRNEWGRHLGGQNSLSLVILTLCCLCLASVRALKLRRGRVRYCRQIEQMGKAIPSMRM